MSGSVVVEAGHTKNFECQVIGNPLPTIKWFKDEVDITQNPRYNIKYRNNGVISLVIDDITAKDQGCYKCKAENSEGAAYTTSYLLVKASSREKSLSAERDITKVVRRTSDSSVSGSESSAFYEESSQVFESSKMSKKKRIKEVVEVVESTRMYEEIITVDADGKEVRTIREVVMTGEGESNAKTRRESTEEITEERRTKEREDREKEETIRLEAEERQKREEERLRMEEERINKENRKLEAEKKRKEEEERTELEERLKREEDERRKMEEEKQRLEEEDRKKREEAEKLREEEERNRSMEESVREKEKRMEEQRSKAEDDRESVTMVTEEEIEVTTSVVEEYAVGTTGEEETPPEPQVAITVDAVTPPVIDVKPEPVSIKVGETILLKCHVSGTPEPDVEWFKEGKLVKQKKSGRVTISAADGLYSLEITEAKKADSGKFTVTATNSEGTIFHEVEVLVTKSKEKTMKDEVPPEFTVKPDNVTVTEFDPVKITCSVSGKPTPTVTWFKDGKPLKSEYNIKLNEEDGGDLYLEILKTSLLDAGEYTCTANNAAGGTFCTVNITVEALTEVDSSASTDLDKEVIKRLTPRIAEEMEKIADQESEKDMLFKEFVMKEDFTDELMKIYLAKSDIVEVMDMKKSDEWLVRKQTQKDQVCYVPVSLLQERDVVDGVIDEELRQVREQVEELISAPAETGTLSLNGLHSPPKETHSPSPDRRRGKLSRSPSKRVGSTDREDASSEDDDFSSKLEALPVYVAIADYSPPDGAGDVLRLKEGQFVDVLDMKNPDNWLVRTKPTKSHPAKIGWVPPCYLEKKDGGGHVDRRTTREVFREDIIQITNKEQEALVKRRYALTELLETERDYVKDLKHIIEVYCPAFDRENTPESLKTKKDLVFGYLEEIYDFHNGHFLSELMNCTNEPSSIGSVFMKWKDKFDLYIPQYEHEKETEQVLNTDDSKQFLKAFGEEIGEETINLLPEYLQKPMLRINKYIQLLKDFVRYSSRAGESCGDLESAIMMLMNIPRQAADLLCLCHIDGYTGNIAELGPILRADDFLVWDTEPVGRAKERRLLLFHDKLLLAKPKKQDASVEEMGYVFKSIIDLHNVQINEQDLDDERMFELWYVDPTCEKLVLQGSTCHAKQAWVKDIRDALRKLGVEETDLSAEDKRKRKVTKTKTPSPKKKPAPEPLAPEELERALLEETDGEPGGTTDDYMTMDSYESDVSSVYHTAAEYEDGTCRPGFKHRLSKVLAVEGSTAKFTCVGGGQPKPDITWLRDNEAIEESDKFKFLKDGDVAVLEIREVTKEDCGIYTAVATNKNGSVSCIAELEMGEDMYKLEESQEEPAADQQQVAPSIVSVFKDIKAFEGEVATFECKISGHPDPEITWYKDGKKIVADGTHFNFLFPDDETYSLVINDVQPTDSGSVSCQAVNKLGDVTVKAKLHVQETPLTFVSKIKEQTAIENSEVTFECEISKQNEDFCWTRNSRKIKSSDKYELIVDGKTHKLVIHNVAVEDAGRFGAEVGLESCSARLNVEEAPLDFTVKFENQEVKEEEDLTLSCEVNKAGSRVTWYKDNERIWPDGRVDVKARGVAHSLWIPGVRLEDAGEYSCRVADQTCKATVAVKEGSPKFKSKLSTPVAMEFEDAILKCELTKPNAVVSWLKNGEEIAASDKYKLVVNGREHSLIIHDVGTDDSAEYTVKAGDNSSTTKLKVQEAPVSFSSKLEDKTIFEGDDACLTCETNKATMEVSWHRYGKKIYPDSRTEMQSDGRTHSLFIHNASFDDSARYTAKVGAESTAAKLTVDEAPLTFTATLEDKTVAPSENLVLSCEVSKSFARVTWYKDGLKLSYDPHYDIRSQGKQLTLTIDKIREEDQGEYSVKTEEGATCSAVVSVQAAPVAEESPLEATQEEQAVEERSLDQETRTDGIDKTADVKPDEEEVKAAVSEETKSGDGEEEAAEVVTSGQDEEEKTLSAQQPEDVAMETSQETPAVDDEITPESDDETEMEELEIQAPPICFTSELMDQTAIKEETITLSCEVNETNAKVTWYKDGAAIAESDKYKFLVTEKRHSMVICGVDIDDSGEYVARTTDGAAATTAKVTVIAEKEKKKEKKKKKKELNEEKKAEVEEPVITAVDTEEQELGKKKKVPTATLR